MTHGPSEITRRVAIAAASALAIPQARQSWATADADDLRSVLDGEDDPSRALAGIAGVASALHSKGLRALALGRAHIDPDRPMTMDAPARVASISKHVTTIGLLQLVEARRVGLDDPASDHLGFALRHPLFPSIPITVRMLLSHTSGIRNGPSYPVLFGRPLSAAFMPDGEQFDHGGWWSRAGEPPGWFHYSDANFACVAQIMENASGERFDKYMSEHVLGPLRLNAGFNWSGVNQSARDRSAACYRKGTDEAHFRPEGPWVPQIDQTPPPAPDVFIVRAPEAQGLSLESYKIGTNGFVFSPQGGLRASPPDLLKIGHLLAAGGTLDGARLFRPETVALMRTPVWRFNHDQPNGDPYVDGAILAYGLGTCILTGAPGPKGDEIFPGCAGWFGHFGDAYGLLSGLWINPETKEVRAYIINGVSTGPDKNAGRHSAFTWQEEQIATHLGRN